MNKIRNDLKESQISWRIALLFLPAAFISFFFHEFGHWTFGEICGNNMTLSLNSSAPEGGLFKSSSHALWSAIGGPAFSIAQALIFLMVVHATKSVYAYSMAFFPAFSRLFSLTFGGFSLQDEARIAVMLHTNSYLIAITVLTILGLIVWQCSRIMKFSIKTIGYFTVMATLTMVIVIGVNLLIQK